ncbi:MAG TPA: hypothetical protein V6D12_13625 [Candidatus Obscuribacterales bacterium]
MERNENRDAIASTTDDLASNSRWASHLDQLHENPKGWRILAKIWEVSE